MNLSAFSEEQVQSARVYAAGVNRRIAAEAPMATYYASHVTSEKREMIKRDNNILASEIERGDHDNNFTIRQRMYYYLTGESVALLP